MTPILQSPPLPTGPEHHPRRLLRILFGALLVAGMAAGYVAMGRQKAAKQAEADAGRTPLKALTTGASTSTISGRGANRYRTPSHRQPTGCTAWSETRCSIGQWPSICRG